VSFRLRDAQLTLDALAFIRQHGVVLESAKGPVPSLVDALAGTPIRGNWWNHPDSKKIYQATRQARSCEDVLVCRLVDGKVTFVHRRLWAAVVRLAKYFKKETLAAIHEEHSASGEHQLKELQFPNWVPVSTRQRAKVLSESQAAAQLGRWATDLLHRT
jgi:hypothetical protein